MTYIYQYGTEFTIKPENVEGAYKALSAKIDRQLLHEWDTLADLLKEWDFAPGDFDDEEVTGITTLEHIADKETWRVEKLFETLAPFVESGSQICFYNDEGEHFRYVFAHGMVFRQDGEVVFPDVPEVPNFWSMPPALQATILEQIKKGAPEE